VEILILRRAALGGALVVALSACSAGGTSSPTAGTSPTAAASASPAPSSEPASASAAAEAGWPYTGALKDGTTFTLKPEIAEKVKAGQPVNYIFSNASSTTDIFSAQMLAGYAATKDQAASTYPLNSKIVSPTKAYDANEQISQIEALFNSNQVDCLSIMVNGADTFTNETQKLLEAGIPVFTVGAPTNGNELQQFTQIPEKEGVQTAQVVLDWAKKNNVALKKFMVSSGAPAATWAMGRMQSFQDTIKAAIPDAEFVADAANGLNTTFEPPKAYDAYKAFLVGHPDVQVLLSADQGAGSAAKAIADSGLTGKAWSIGWNPSDDQLDAIDNGLQIAVMDQKWGDQAGFGAPACANFFKDGTILPNSQKLVAVTKENSAEARSELQKLLANQ
jgi:ribose transport system substrate-binding protein